MTAIIVCFSVALTFSLWAWRKGYLNINSMDGSAFCFTVSLILWVITLFSCLLSPLKWKTEEVKDTKIALINGKHYLVTGGGVNNWELDIWNPNKKTYRTIGYNIFGQECFKNYLQ